MVQSSLYILELLNKETTKNARILLDVYKCFQKFMHTVKLHSAGDLGKQLTECKGT